MADGLVTGFDGDTYRIIIGLDEGTYLGFLDRSCYGCNDGNLAGLVKGFRYSTNSVVG